MLLGIDFGTSFSKVSTIDSLGRPTLLLHPGEYGIPSEFYLKYGFGWKMAAYTLCRLPTCLSTR